MSGQAFHWIQISQEIQFKFVSQLNWNLNNFQAAFFCVKYSDAGVFSKVLKNDTFWKVSSRKRMGLVFITPIIIRSESSVISKNLRYSSKMQEIPAKTKMSEKNNSIVTFGFLEIKEWNEKIIKIFTR